MSDNKIVRILSEGFQRKEDDRTERIPDTEQQVSISIDTVQDPEEDMMDTIASLRGQVEELQMTIRELRSNPPFPDMSAYVTSREMVKSLTAAIENQSVALADKRMIETMTQVATMREDFFKLCTGMRAKLRRMPKEDMISSFEAYEVDMENILTDRGVFIGHFPFESLNTTHQRIVEVVPTDDPELNGMVADRLSDGYKMGDRVLYKEKVAVYKYTGPASKSASGKSKSKEEPTETVSETASEQTEKTTQENNSEVEE